MPVPAPVIRAYEASLARCNADPAFIDRFYETFLACSPKVREKFAKTDFTRQKQALRESLGAMTAAAAEGPEGAERHLTHLAHRHSSRDLDIGAGLYDDWLDSLLSTVRRTDPEFNQEVAHAWEEVMMVGIRYLLLHY